jgi:UDP-N-acetylmuramoyl-tripeptide--D-alanyl-D-alanine ligase
MAAPDVGVLTLIGYEHTEGLGDLDGVEEEEASLFAGVSVAVGNVDDERVARQLARVTSPKVSYGKHATADYRFRVLGLSARGSELAVTRLLAGREVTTSFRTSTLGDAGAYAACAALAAAETLLGRELSADTLTTAFASSVASEAGRLCPIELDDGTLVLDDTYNANPESVLSSVSLARQLAEQRAVPLLLVLGEMRELGALSATLHRQVGEAVAAQRPALLISIAGDARLFADVAAARGIFSEFAEDSEAGADLLLTRLSGPAVILVKASRGVRAEKVVSRLISAKGRAA